MNRLSPMKLVLAVVDPEYAPETDIARVIAGDKRLFKSAVQVAERNGLYYYFMCRLKELEVALPFEDEKRWQEENRGLQELKKTITLLNDVSKDCGASYIWIKSCNPIPHIPRDVDILVREGEKEYITTALAEEDMRYDQPSKVQVLLEKKGLLRIDVYSEICYFTVKFLDDDFLWSSVIEDEMFGVMYPNLNKEANFLLSLVHSLFGHRSMSLLDFLHLKSLRNSIDVDACRKCALQNGWGPVFDLYLNELDNIRDRIYEKEEAIRFPYIFNTDLVLRCASMIDGLSLSRPKRIALSVSLALDKFRASQKNSTLYRLLRSFEPTRRLLNKIITIFRTMRGDKTA